MKNRKLLIARIVMTVLSVGAVCFIFGNSLMDADDSSTMSEGVLEFINRLLCSLNIDLTLGSYTVRKAAHFTEFAVLGALLCATAYLYLFRRLRSALISVPLGALTAVCDELIQTLSVGRSCQIGDMLIDTAGVLTGTLITLLIITVIIRKKKNKAKTEGENNG